VLAGKNTTASVSQSRSMKTDQNPIIKESFNIYPILL